MCKCAHQQGKWHPIKQVHDPVSFHSVQRLFQELRSTISAATLLDIIAMSIIMSHYF